MWVVKQPDVFYTRKNAQLVNKLCSQQACNKLVNKFVAMLLFCQIGRTKFVTHNLLTSC